jgi:hypothetical protein
MTASAGAPALLEQSRTDDLGEPLGGAPVIRVPTIIPGAYERNTLTYRQPGSMGAGAFGAGSVPSSDSTLDAATTLEREKEGGGGATQRPDPHRTQSPSSDRR